MSRRADELLAAIPRERFATLPTALEDGGRLQSRHRLLIKRDDLTGLGLGGNKVRKLEFLAADALGSGADLFVTVGAAQSNHVRMTAAAGSRLGIDTHAILGGGVPPGRTGNQLLTWLFGAQMHHFDTDDWSRLEAHMDALVEEWIQQGRQPYSMPIGGSTPIGALGFVVAWREFLEQCDEQQVEPSAVFHASSSGGTHAGMLAGRALYGGPPIVAVGVAKTAVDLAAHARELANDVLDRLGGGQVDHQDVVVLEQYCGEAYAVPTQAGDDALGWAARRGWVVDRVYSAKALSGLLGEAEAGSVPDGDLVFWHTGGQPAVFSPGGVPPER